MVAAIIIFTGGGSHESFTPGPRMAPVPARAPVRAPAPQTFESNIGNGKRARRKVLKFKPNVKGKGQLRYTSNNKVVHTVDIDLVDGVQSSVEFGHKQTDTNRKVGIYIGDKLVSKEFVF